MTPQRLAPWLVLTTCLLTACGPSQPPTMPLFRAIHTGNLDQVKRHLRQGTDINQTGPDGETPLHVAARDGRVAMVELLLKHGASIDARDHNDRTPMELALLAGKVQVARVLAKRGAAFDPQALLLLMADRGVADRDVLRFLIHAGARLDGTDQEGFSPLHIAIVRGNLRLGKRLLIMGANPNQPLPDGSLPLDAARLTGIPELVRLLRDYGARSKGDPSSARAIPNDEVKTRTP